MFTIQVGKKYVRVESYGNFTLVEFPYLGTLYTRLGNAEKRKDSVEETIRLFKPKLQGQSVRVLEVEFEYHLRWPSVRKGSF